VRCVCEGWRERESKWWRELEWKKSGVRECVVQGVGREVGGEARGLCVCVCVCVEVSGERWR